MRKILAILALIVVGFLAVSAYRAKTGARESEANIRYMETQMDHLEEELNVLRNEKAHLSRPERIDKIAREQLGMEPQKPEQMVSAGDMVRRLAGEPTEFADAETPPQPPSRRPRNLDTEGGIAQAGFVRELDER